MNIKGLTTVSLFMKNRISMCNRNMANMIADILKLPLEDCTALGGSEAWHRFRKPMLLLVFMRRLEQLQGHPDAGCRIVFISAGNVFPSPTATLI